MKYQCPRCEYISNELRNVKRHVSRENTCHDKFNTGIIPTEKDIIKLVNEKFHCDYCENDFSSPKILRSHKQICNPGIDKFKQIIDKLKQTNDDLSKSQLIIATKPSVINISGNNADNIIIDNSVNNSVDNSTNNNIVNNIFVNNYKESSTNHISHDEIMTCMKRCMMAVPYMIEKIHFDKNVPENHNVCLSNHKEKKALIKENGQWLIKNAPDLVSNIYNDCHFKMFHQFSENPEMQELYPDLERIYDNYKKRTEGNEKIIYEYMLEILYNNRKLCLEAKKHSELTKK